MLGDAKLRPNVSFPFVECNPLTVQTFPLLIIDACGLTTAEYDEYKRNFLHDLEDDRVHPALHMYHNWGWRV